MQKIIVISGIAGTGKSTLAKGLAERLGWRFISIGQFVRKMAKEVYNVDIYQFQKIAEKDHSIDQKIDDYIVSQVEKLNENVILDYRLGYYFFSKAYKIKLTTDIEELAKRIKERNRDLKDNSLKEVENLINYRVNKTRERFKSIYNTDFLDDKNYDLVINNTFLSPERTLNLVLNFVEKHYKLQTIKQ